MTRKSPLMPRIKGGHKKAIGNDINWRRYIHSLLLLLLPSSRPFFLLFRLSNRLSIHNVCDAVLYYFSLYLEQQQQTIGKRHFLLLLLLLLLLKNLFLIILRRVEAAVVVFESLFLIVNCWSTGGWLVLIISRPLQESKVERTIKWINKTSRFWL